MWVEVPGPNTHLHVLNDESRGVTLTAPPGGHHLTTCWHPGMAPLLPSLQSCRYRTPTTHTQKGRRGRSSWDGSHLGPGPGVAHSGLPCVTSGFLGQHRQRRWRWSLSQRPQRAGRLSLFASLTSMSSEGSAQQDRMLLCRASLVK